MPRSIQDILEHANELDRSWARGVLRMGSVVVAIRLGLLAEVLRGQRLERVIRVHWCYLDSCGRDSSA